MTETTHNSESPGPENSTLPPRRAVRSRPAAEPAPLENRPPSNWSGPEPEYEDEAPGAYLEELGVGAWNVGWATLNLALTLWIGLYASLAGINAEWQFLAGVTWALLPVSGGILLLITLWQKASVYTKNSPGRSRWTLLLSCAALVLWFIFGGEGIG